MSHSVIRSLTASTATLRHESLPRRPADRYVSENGAASRFENADVPLPSIETNDRFVQGAISEGKEISRSLAAKLRRSVYANDENSALHQVIRLADELGNFESSLEFTVGFVGDSGVGE